MSRPTALRPELVQALKRLRLGALTDVLPARLALAEAHKLPPEEVLLMILTDEISRRDSTAAARRAADGHLDPDMTFERWDGSAKVHLDPRVLAELRTLRFLRDRRHIVILGPVGTGKTFLANALGMLACQHGHRVLFQRADDLLRTLRQSRLDNSRDATMTELCAIDVLVIDDFALEPMTREESRDVYQLFVERTGRASTLVTSNRDTSEWIAMFDDVLLAQSAVDRFKNAAFDLVIEGESYRPRLKPVVTDNPNAEPVHTRPSHPSSRRRRTGPR